MCSHTFGQQCDHTKDRIVVLEDGKIREEGTHDDLLISEGSLYKKLWNLQAGGFIPV
jgi:ABC-type multidrug transport system fused ATPase/permease subunit